MYRSRLERMCDIITDFQDHLPRTVTRFGPVGLMFGALALVGTSFLPCPPTVTRSGWVGLKSRPRARVGPVFRR